MTGRTVSFVRADHVGEAVAAWNAAAADGRTAAYVGGGTEIVTLEREGKVAPDVLIDYKRIPGLARLGVEDERFVYGAAARLTEVAETDPCGIVARASAGVADRTIRNSITLGGNAAGMLPYREALLPFLLLDGEIEIAAPDGRWAPLGALFDRRLRLPPGALVTAFSLPATLVERWSAPEAAARHPDGHDPGYGPVTRIGGTGESRWFYQRRTRDPRLDYPLATVLMARLGDDLRIVIAGTWGAPVRLSRGEELVAADGGASRLAGDAARAGALAERIVASVDYAVRDDLRATAVYRRAVTVAAVAEGLVALTREEHQ